MSKLNTEIAIETFAIELFENLGYRYVYASECIRTLETLRDTLLPNLMIGEVRVTV